MALLPLRDPLKANEPRGIASLRLAFRPFYLLAATAGMLYMPLWLLVFTGRLQPASHLPPVSWHGHEMIFCMVTAVIVGFLFTAGRTWTGLPTPRGGQLLFLVLLWLSGRFAAVYGTPMLFFLLDVAFLPLAATLFADLLIRAGNRRNFIIAGLLLLLGLINLGFHLACRQVLAIDPVDALHAGLACVVLIESKMAGRVIPFFTRSVTPGLQNAVPEWREGWLDACTVLGLLCWLGRCPSLMTSSLLFGAAGLHAWRLWTWSPTSTRRKPILWSLFVAYAWIPAGMFLLGLAVLMSASPSPAMHAFAVGATGGLLIAMMTRTARGHTGRPLVASRAETLAYALMATAAMLRVVPPLFWPGTHPIALILAGTCFASAFGIYVVLFAPWLLTTRTDGKDG